MTGIDQRECILVAEQRGAVVRETIFVLEPDDLAERWTGKRLKAHEVTQLSELENVRPVSQFESYFNALMKEGLYKTILLDLYKHESGDLDTEAFKFAERMKKAYPHVGIQNGLPQIRKQRTLKQPCEIEAIRNAVAITRAGIKAMMKASQPGMYEYEQSMIT